MRMPYETYYFTCYFKNMKNIPLANENTGVWKDGSVIKGSLILMESTQVHFMVPIWQVCNVNSRGLNALWPMQVPGTYVKHK